jgi:hypothetical protein
LLLRIQMSTRCALFALLFLTSAALTGCATNREVVVRDSKGTELRGEVVGPAESCRLPTDTLVADGGTGDGLCHVRIAGGSVLSMPTGEVATGQIEHKYRNDTGHSGQLGLIVSAGAAVGLTTINSVNFALTGPVSARLTFGPTDAFELALGYAGLLGGALRQHYATIGERYFFSPNDTAKVYSGFDLLIGTGVGVHSRSGIQFDFSRRVGLFFESGFTVTLEYIYTNGLTLYVDAQIGLQFKIDP